MNYFQARQVDPTATDCEDAGKWRYTQMRDKQVWPVGYCAENCPGHDDKDGAYEHQRQYELDNARFNEGPNHERALHRSMCQALAGDGERCGKLTTSSAGVGPGMSYEVTLCVGHLNRGGLASAWDGPGNVVSS